MVLHLCVRRIAAAGAGLLIAGIAIASAPVHARAVVCDSWTGAASHDWNDARNWSAGVPTSAVDVCIPTSNATTVNAPSAEHAASLWIGAGSTLTLAPGAALTTARDITLDGALWFNDSSAVVNAPRVHVLHDGSLVGIGSVNGGLENEGSVEVIDGGSGVPLRVSGQYAQAPSANLLVRDEGGQFTELKAASASLAGSLYLQILDALTPGTTYTIVQSPTISGAFVKPFGYRVEYQPGDVAVVVKPEIALGRRTIPPGSRVSVSGFSFGDLGTVKLHLDSATGPIVGSASVTSVGSFQGFARIPSTATAGRHVLVAINVSYGYRARKSFVVT